MVDRHLRARDHYFTKLYRVCSVAIGKEVIVRFTHNINNGIAALISRAKLRYELKMGASQ